MHIIQVVDVVNDSLIAGGLTQSLVADVEPVHTMNHCEWICPPDGDCTRDISGKENFGRFTRG